MRKPDAPRRAGQRGITMIEVLVTLVIVAVGLMGLAALQISSVNSQMEAYQRTQALFLMDDMANRIRANAAAARNGDYGQAGDLGIQEPQDCSTIGTAAARDLCEWNIALSGAGVTLDGNNVGSMVGARACIENIPDSGDGETIIRLTVAWQGMAPTVSPASNCGRDAYGDDRFRRTASVDTVLANLAI